MVPSLVVSTLTAPGDPRTARAVHPASFEPLAAGARLGRYVIRDRLGSGGMSHVYRAEDPGLRREVAIKLLHPERALGAAARERFAREGQAMARLTHANVATVFDTGEDGDRCYLALELLEGGTLADWLAAGRGEREIHLAMRGAARGLAAAHALGIVHRDFKPENVLFTRDGTPRVCDFGLAATTAPEPAADVSDAAARGTGGDLGHGAGDDAAGDDARLTVAGAVMGTPAYMAPEQRDGRAADERTDQFSLCLVWLEALGRDRATPAGAAGGARGEAPVIRALVRGLAADPARRWPSIAALLAELDVLEQRRTRRRWNRAAIAIVAVGAAIAAAVWARARDPQRPGAAPAPSAAEQVLRRHKAGEGTWRMNLSGDGTMVVRDSSERDALWLEPVDGGPSSAFALPAGRTVSRRMDAIPAVSRDAAVVLVRMEDRSLWRTGDGVAAPVLMRTDGSGPVCLHASGTRAVTAAMREPIEIRSTADGRLLGTGPIADLCTWLGDRLVLGTRGRATTRLSVLEPDGRTRDLIELPGDLGALAVDRAGRIVVAHHVREGDGAGTGTLTSLSADGPPSPRRLRTSPGVGYQFLAATARGLFLAEVPLSSHLMIAALDGDPPLALRALETGTPGDTAPIWLDDERVVYGQAGARIVSQRAGHPGTTTLAGRGVPLAVSAGELLIQERDTDGVHDLHPRCRVVAIALAGDHRRVIDERPCAELGSVRCHDRGPCLLGIVRGDEVHFAALDPVHATLAPPLVARPLSGTPSATLAPDGRWLIESAGDLTFFDPTTRTEHPFPLPAWPIDYASFHPDGSLLASSRSDKAFALLRLSPSGTVHVLAESPQTQFGAPVVSPDGRRLAVLGTERLPVYVLVADAGR